MRSTKSSPDGGGQPKRQYFLSNAFLEVAASGMIERSAHQKLL